MNRIRPIENNFSTNAVRKNRNVMEIKKGFLPEEAFFHRLYQ